LSRTCASTAKTRYLTSVATHSCPHETGAAQDLTWQTERINALSHRLPRGGAEVTVNAQLAGNMTAPPKIPFRYIRTVARAMMQWDVILTPEADVYADVDVDVSAFCIESDQRGRSING